MGAASRDVARHLLVPEARARALRRAAADWPSWTVAGEDLTHLEALLSGLLWPISGYAGRDADARYPWPVPALRTPGAFASSIGAGTSIGLRDAEGVLLAALHVRDTWPEDGTSRIAGDLEGIELPVHYDFPRLRLRAERIRELTAAVGRPHVMVFYPGDVLHAGTRAALAQLADRLDAAILLLVATAATGAGELAAYARVRALELSASQLPSDRTITAVVPVALPADPLPRAALQAWVAANCGATHCALEASLAPTQPMAAPPADQVILPKLVALETYGYSSARGDLAPYRAGDPGVEPPLPEPEILARIGASEPLPAWLLTPAELQALERVRVPRVRQGFSVFFTGLSGSGKSTIAGALRARLMETTGRAVTLLDGDLVRHHLSSELGFSREHRNLNVLRIGWVASEITRHGGIAICAPIAPYDDMRKRVRAMIERVGGFLLVHVATSLETCERRDRKGLYARARAGVLPEFTGVSDPYEEPADAGVRIDTELLSVDAACDAVLAWLRSAGYLSQPDV